MVDLGQSCGHRQSDCYQLDYYSLKREILGVERYVCLDQLLVGCFTDIDSGSRHQLIQNQLVDGRSRLMGPGQAFGSR